MNEPELTPRVIAEGLDRPNGPAFDPDGHLWCSVAGGLVRVDTATHERTRIDTGGAPAGIAIDAYGRIWFADSGQNAIRRYDPDDRKLVTIVEHVDGEPLNKPNDLAFDARGNLLFTCAEYVCCLQPDDTIEQVANELHRPSGLAVLHGGETLILAEAGRQRLWRGEWDDDRCVWTHEVTWSQNVMGDPGPGGMAMSIDGRMYVAVYGSQRIMALNADGLIVETFDLPGNNPTNCAFDPYGRLGLVVSEAEKGQLLSIPGLGPGVQLFDGGSAWAL